MHLFKFKRVKQIASSACALFVLIACTPAHDWRTSRISSHGDAYTITFPGKYLSAQKTVTLAGQPHALTLSAVQVDEAQFALGSVPAQNAAQAKAIAAVLAEAFANNLNIKPEQTASQPVSLVFKNAVTTALEGSPSGALDVSYPIASGASGRFAQARFIWTQSAAYELLVVGPAKQVTPELADMFIRSMKFE